MYAERVILETDAQGQIKALPTLPVNRRLEAIFLILDADEASEMAWPATQAESNLQTHPVRRRPSPGLAGRVQLLAGDLTGSAPSADWDLPS
jgi:hypothetical protein